MRALLPGLWQVPLGIVNSYVLDSPQGLILMDCGSPGQAGEIIAALAELGRGPEDLKHILISHCHPHHAGGLAELKRLTGAETWMHPFDANLVRQGLSFRPIRAAPGLVNWMLYRRLISQLDPQIEAAPIDHELVDGQRLPFLDLEVVHAPGHCAGQVVFHWPVYNGVLFAADAACNIPTLRESISYEDIGEGRMTLRKLASLEFGFACFGHGMPIRQEAAERFRRKWGGKP